ncbi:imidazole glycerol phosphate synthase subunit HisH [Lacinutrix sp. C3R15]|uniref:imidazole glycerol phosphate synthase subunit HisH n=1 Tax=Flavobacteriaceae TaxID=49546 RepID=UPI001C097894|nr:MULTISPECIES: imidazole glycerol phosphate synthase subunit HisH [Flavobacteriaceae]MBU2939956.1 imidazole glycerol phosphate synthase subunit HisH [Lacinutrix sp. C3R15]MDO6623273.1 imidazole glycerol phosphate synthase subunit HisH [Oceanihabitans sp. 1_MG-2023]
MIAIIKYNAGNIRSVQNALNRLGYDSIITDDKTEILNASKVIFPGVGEASSAMQYLREKGLDEVLLSVKKPMLGICLGLQLMCNYSEEGDTKCLGIFNTQVKKFPPKEKVPHIGWNNFAEVTGDLFNNIDADKDMYYVHSYYAEDNAQSIATCNYILPFATAMQHDNFYATQFHPEKSADVGAQLLKNFLELE